MLGISMSYCCQSSTQGWMDIWCISYTIPGFWDHQGLVGLQYGKPVHAFTWTTLPHRRLFPGFPLGMHNFQFCTVKALQKVRHGLCCHPVGDNLITAHGPGRVSCLPGPVSSWLEAQSTHLSWDPLPLVHGEIFARPGTAWASKLTRPGWVFPAAIQALEDAWLTGSWDVSDRPTALCHLEAALNSRLTSQFSPWFPQALRAMVKRGFWVPTTAPACKGS